MIRSDRNMAEPQQNYKSYPIVDNMGASRDPEVSCDYVRQREDDPSRPDTDQ